MPWSVSHLIAPDGEDLTYCQSKDRLNNPIPSLLIDPPKRFVSTAALLPVAFIAAKHYRFSS